MVLSHVRGACVVLICLLAGSAEAVENSPELGVPAGADELATRAQIIFADGRGLPPGSGNPQRGALLYASRCAGCHGPDGRGGTGGELAGGNRDLTSKPVDKTIGTYWPYAPTLFDFVRRAMPPEAPWSLNDNEVYAVVAYLLALNALWPAGATLDARGLSSLRMPNRNGFLPIDAGAETAAVPPLQD